MQTYKIDENTAGQRLHRFLQRELPAASESFLYKMLRKKNIVLNGGRAKGSETLKTGDQIDVYFSDETFAKFALRTVPQRQAPPMPPVLFENEDLLFVDKPAGMLVQADATKEGALSDALLAYLNVSAGSGGFHPGPLNRLDRNTSGIVICSKTLYGAQAMSQLIRERALKKVYRVVTSGKAPEGHVRDAWEHGRTKVILSDVSAKSATLCETIFLPLAENERFTYLSAELVTGRKHQIRAQLERQHAPIVGDPLYGDPAINARAKEKYGITRQLLHAVEIRFPESLPAFPDLEGKVIRADLPQDIQNFLMGEGIEESR